MALHNHNSRVRSSQLRGSSAFICSNSYRSIGADLTHSKFSGDCFFYFSILGLLENEAYQHCGLSDYLTMFQQLGVIAEMV